MFFDIFLFGGGIVAANLCQSREKIVDDYSSCGSDLSRLGQELVEAEMKRLELEKRIKILRSAYEGALEILSQIQKNLEDVKPPESVTPIEEVVPDGVVAHLLRGAGIKTVEQLCRYTKADLFRLGMGPEPVATLEAALRSRGLCLRANGSR